MTRRTKEELTLRALSERTGVPPRTIRFYIAQGLLPGPLRSGRGATYDNRHLEGLGRIAELKSEGYTISEIRRLTGSGTDRGAHSFQPTAWLNYEVAPDVVVQVRSDASPWRLRAIQNMIRDIHSGLRDEKPESEEKDSGSNKA